MYQKIRSLTRKWKVYVIAVMLVFIPMMAMAGWTDFIGTSTKAVSEAVVGYTITKAIEKNLVTLSFLIYSILATIQLVVAGGVVREFAESFKSANEDNVIRLSENIFLGFQAFISLLIVIGLLLFAGFLGYTVWDGLTEIQNFKGFGWDQ